VNRDKTWLVSRSKETIAHGPVRVVTSTVRARHVRTALKLVECWPRAIHSRRSGAKPRLEATVFKPRQGCSRKLHVYAPDLSGVRAVRAVRRGQYQQCACIRNHQRSSVHRLCSGKHLPHALGSIRQPKWFAGTAWRIQNGIRHHSLPLNRKRSATATKAETSSFTIYRRWDEGCRSDTASAHPCAFQR
jgi:hypothetical protein